MRTLVFKPPTFGFIVATRAALGFGLGLLAAPKIKRSRRRRLGLTLAIIGLATTVPAAALAIGQLKAPAA
jgi:hypothetical protein